MLITTFDCFLTRLQAFLCAVKVRSVTALETTMTTRFEPLGAQLIAATFR